MIRNFNSQQKKIIIGRDECHCIYCGKYATGIDHSEGGPTFISNGVCCCRSCNSSKHTSLDEKWIVKGLARLIQHGEDISWIANIRKETVVLESTHRIMLTLYEHDFSIAEIATVLDLTHERVLVILDEIDSKLQTK